MSTLLDRKKTHFVLWRPALANMPATPPNLVLGQFQDGNPPVLVNQRSLPMVSSPLSSANDLWEIAAADCGLIDGQVYHYWFEVSNSNVYSGATSQRLRCTDPSALTTDWRLTSTVPAGDTTDSVAALAVIRFSQGKLVPSDPGAVPQSFDVVLDASMSSLPANNRLVIYELPTAWTKTGDLVNATNVGV